MSSEMIQSVDKAAETVYTELGPGLSERAYHNAMETELSHQGVEFSSEAILPILYRGKPVAYRRPDLLVGNDEVIVVELKVTDSGEEQLQSYADLGKNDENLTIVGAMLISFSGDSPNVQSEAFNTSGS